MVLFQDLSWIFRFTAVLFGFLFIVILIERFLGKPLVWPLKIALVGIALYIGLPWGEWKHGQEAPGYKIQPGVAPVSAWQCPGTHPIKGNFTTYSGERCIYHVPGGAFYNKTKPEKCYVTETDAEADGCRASKR